MGELGLHVDPGTVIESIESLADHLRKDNSCENHSSEAKHSPGT